MVEYEPDVNVAAPNINVRVFGEGSIGDAVSGFIGGIIKGFADLTKVLTDEDKAMSAVAKITAVLIVMAALIITFRSLGSARRRV